MGYCCRVMLPPSHMSVQSFETREALRTQHSACGSCSDHVMVQYPHARHAMQALIGPPQAECFQNQRYRMYRDNHLVLETSQTMPNIPFGDHFTVEVRWDVTQLPGVTSQCRVQSCVFIPFSKATWWKKVRCSYLHHCAVLAPHMHTCCVCC